MQQSQQNTFTVTVKRPIYTALVSVSVGLMVAAVLAFILALVVFIIGAHEPPTTTGNALISVTYPYVYNDLGLLMTSVGIGLGCFFMSYTFLVVAIVYDRVSA